MSKIKILVADDEAEIRDLLRLYLENSGYDVLEAADGLEALHMRMAEQGQLRAAFAGGIRQRRKLPLDAKEMAVRRKDPHAVKFQRQHLRDGGGIVTVAGDVIKVRVLIREGEVLRIAQVVAQVDDRVRGFLFYGFAYHVCCH